jgi:mRNA interferase HigB
MRQTALLRKPMGSLASGLDGFEFAVQRPSCIRNEGSPLKFKKTHVLGLVQPLRPISTSHITKFALATSQNTKYDNPGMHVISEKALRLFWMKHEDAELPLRAWLKITEKAQWRNLADVRRVFNSADVVDGIYTVFNIKGNTYRLVTAIHYNRRMVFIRHVFTHAEYDRWNEGNKK